MKEMKNLVFIIDNRKRRYSSQMQKSSLSQKLQFQLSISLNINLPNESAKERTN